jgi:hypothetical protein
MAELIRRTDAVFLGIIDGVVIFWLVLWTAAGSWVGLSLWRLSSLGDTIVEAGRTVDSAGTALQDVADLPLIGKWPLQLAGEIQATAAQIMNQGSEVTAYGRQLGVLLGIAVALAPVMPVLVSYLPARLNRRREVADLDRSLRDPDKLPAVDFHLAHQALSTLPLHQLCRLTDDPRRDLAEGRLQPLADAELARLGLSRHDGSVRR